MCGLDRLMNRFGSVETRCVLLCSKLKVFAVELWIYKIMGYLSYSSLGRYRRVNRVTTERKEG